MARNEFGMVELGSADQELQLARQCCVMRASVDDRTEETLAA